MPRKNQAKAKRAANLKLARTAKASHRLSVLAILPFLYLINKARYKRKALNECISITPKSLRSIPVYP
jgi:hypothetical protein